MITQSELNKLFDYKDGALIWKVKRQSIQIGAKAGSVTSGGYLQTRVNGKNYMVHRLVFLYHNGFLPEYVDHIDGNKLNNEIANLRPATRQQNQFNRKINKTNTSGVKCVRWDKSMSKWCARLRINGKRINLGYFDNLDVAESVIRLARIKHHGEYCNHGN